MTTSPVLKNFINEARHEIQPNNALRHIFSYEQVMLERLIHAIDSQSDKELTTTVFKMKTELDTLRCSVLTVLPALVNVLASELHRQA